MTGNLAIVPTKAVKRPTPLNRAAFDDFVEECSYAAECASDLQAALTKVEKEFQPRTALAALEKSLSPDRIGRAMKAAQSCLDVFDEHYDDEDEDRYRAAVSIQIGKLLGSFPNANPSDPEVYTGCMIEDVIAEAQVLPALQLACQRLRRQSKFPPSISELIAALEGAGNDVCGGLRAIYAVRDIRDRVERLRTDLTDRCAKLAAPADNVGPAHALGERVIHVKFGVGSVTACEGNRLDVDFDLTGRKQVLASFVERVTD